jgi:hypothetical protein
VRCGQMFALKRFVLDLPQANKQFLKPARERITGNGERLFKPSAIRGTDRLLGVIGLGAVVIHAMLSIRHGRRSTWNFNHLGTAAVEPKGRSRQPHRWPAQRAMACERFDPPRRGYRAPEALHVITKLLVARRANGGDTLKDWDNGAATTSASVKSESFQTR